MSNVRPSEKIFNVGYVRIFFIKTDLNPNKMDKPFFNFQKDLSCSKNYFQI